MRRYAVSGWRTMLVVLALIAAFPLTAAAQPPLEAPEQSGWVVEAVPTGSTMYALDMAGANYGWAGGVAGIMFEYQGGTWNAANPPTPFSSPVRGLDILSASSGWGVTFMGEVIRFDGYQWTVQDKVVNAPLDDIYMFSDTSGWAVGSINPDSQKGTILRWDGSSWTPYDSGITAQLKAIDFINPNDGWIVGVSGTISRWNGVSWATGTYGPENVFLDVDMVGAKDVWIVGAGGVIRHYNGSALLTVPSPTTNDLNAIQMVSASDGWAVGGKGTILQYKDGQWQLFSSPTTNDLSAISMVSPTLGWVAGRSGALLRYTGTLTVTASETANPPRLAAPGETMFAIDVNSAGDMAASPLEITSAIPPYTTYVPGSAKGTPGLTITPPSGSTPLQATMATLQPGTEVTLTFKVTTEDRGLACWFVLNQTSVHAGELQFSPQAVVLVGDCPNKLFLPIILKGSS
jgi:hypothetical protein